MLLLCQVDRRLPLPATLAKRLPDPRDPTRVIHPLVTLLRQRFYGLCRSYEELNDRDRLRTNVALQTAVEQDEDDLARASTLARWETGADRQAAWLVHQSWSEQFIASQALPPAELEWDLEATDDPLHGKPEGAFFRGYYGPYCFLPLYVFCGQRLLVAYLRPSNIDVARQAWPSVKGVGGRVFTGHEKPLRTVRKTYPTHQIHQKSSFSTIHATSGLSYSRLASRFFNAGSVC